MRLALLALLLSSAAPALAQPTTVEGRVGKLEKEMRAVQRKVFPEGSQQFLEPEIRPAAPAAAPAGVPASNALIDLTARVDALEGQLRQMTGQVEQNQFRLRQLEEAVAKLRADAEARALPPEAAAVAPPVATVPETPAPVRPAPARPRTPEPAPIDAAPTPPVAATPAPNADPAEEAYLAGYRLWEQKRYPEAQEALRAAAKKYPKHRRYSYAQNLLGRAYLDDGKPGLAAQELYANYRTMPRGERAQDSLLYLGQALTRLKKPAEACRVFDELQDVYGQTIRAELKPRIATARTEAKCGA